jgi:membrane-bound lytic murein transglycosylase D
MIIRLLSPTLFILILCLNTLRINAQVAKVSDSLKSVRSQSLEKNKKVLDTVMFQDFKGDINFLVRSISKNDSLGYALKDQKKAKISDSLWLKELYDSSRFEEVYGSIVNEEIKLAEYEELPTELLKKRLEQLNAKTPFNVTYNPSLERLIKHYLKTRRVSMSKLMALSDYFFPMFEEEFDKYDLPLEIKYLAVVESALNPLAKSRVGAKGLWQFMFTTGKIYGLEVSSYVDERADPKRATTAAAKYLKSLYKIFDDWDLALAAYNSGPGNVSKAIRRSGGETNYWKIRNRLPRETAGYVPAFLATMYIFEYADEHGFKSNGPKYHTIETDTIHVKRLITFEQVSKALNVPIEEIKFLNPSYKLGIIPYIEDKNYTLRLPIRATGKFVTNEEAIYALADEENSKENANIPKYIEQPDRIRYRVKSGDYLGKIAERYGVGVSQIKRWNELKNDNLKVGQRLIIYPTKPIALEDTSEKETRDLYTVKKGDSLWSISQNFPGVSIQNIKKWNDISSNILRPGMKLKISKG